MNAFPQVGCIIRYHYMLSGLNVTYTVVSINLAKVARPISFLEVNIEVKVFASESMTFS